MTYSGNSYRRRGGHVGSLALGRSTPLRLRLRRGGPCTERRGRLALLQGGEPHRALPLRRRLRPARDCQATRVVRRGDASGASLFVATRSHDLSRRWGGLPISSGARRTWFRTPCLGLAAAPLGSWRQNSVPPRRHETKNFCPRHPGTRPGAAIRAPLLIFISARKKTGHLLGPWPVPLVCCCVCVAARLADITRLTSG